MLKVNRSVKLEVSSQRRVSPIVGWEKHKRYFLLPTSYFSINEGFTLIELLTVIGILSIIGTIAVSVITISLQGSKKSDLLETARQNGDTSLSQMVRNIRYAASLNAPASCVPSTTTSSITITSLTDYTQTTYSCAAGTISSNGASMFDTSALKVSSCSFICRQPTVQDPPTITIQYILSPKQAGGFVETNFTLPFQTSVTMRNVGQ